MGKTAALTEPPGTLKIRGKWAFGPDASEEMQG